MKKLQANKIQLNQLHSSLMTDKYQKVTEAANHPIPTQKIQETIKSERDFLVEAAEEIS